MRKRPIRGNGDPYQEPSLVELYGREGADAIERLARASALASMAYLASLGTGRSRRSYGERDTQSSNPEAHSETRVLHANLTVALRAAASAPGPVGMLTDYDLADPLAVNFRAALAEARQAELPWLTIVATLQSGHEAAVNALGLLTPAYPYGRLSYGTGEFRVTEDGAAPTIDGGKAL